MAGVRGRRKAMLLIGEGVDYDIFETVGQLGSTASSVIQDTHDAIAAATRGNVSIYTIDPRGLASGTEELIAGSARSRTRASGLGSIIASSGVPQDSLRVLAANTGGFAVVNRNDMTGVRPHRRREQQLLRARLLRDQRAARRPLPQARGAASSVPGCGCARAAATTRRAAARPGRRTSAAERAVAGRRRRRCRARCRWPACRSRCSRRRSRAWRRTRRWPSPSSSTPPSSISSRRTAPSTNRSKWRSPPSRPTARSTRGDRHTVALAMKPDTLQRARERGIRVLTQHSVAARPLPAAHRRRQQGGHVRRQRPLRRRGARLLQAAAVDERRGDHLDRGGAGDDDQGQGSAGRLPARPGHRRARVRPRRGAGDVRRVLREPGQRRRRTSSSSAPSCAPRAAASSSETIEERSSTEVQGRSGGYGFTAAVPARGSRAGPLRAPRRRGSRASATGRPSAATSRCA